MSTSNNFCSLFPQQCQPSVLPYIEGGSIQGGASTYLLLQEGVSKVVNFYGQNLNMSIGGSGPKCLFNNLQTQATVLSSHSISCQTPAFQNISEQIKLRISYGGVIVEPFKPLYLKLMEMPQLLSINGKSQIFLTPGQLPYNLKVQVQYPQNWADAQSFLKYLLQCTSQTLVVPATTNIFTIPAGIVGNCSFLLIEGTQISTTQPGRHTVQILDLSTFQIISVDKPIKYITMNQTMVQVNISTLSSAVMMANIEFARFILYSVNINTTVQSESMTLISNQWVNIQFPNGQNFQPGFYCLEIQIGEASSQTCSQSLEFRHKATVWQSLDQIVQNHSLASVVKGAYLNNLDPSSINCIYEHYLNYTGSNILTNISKVPATFNSTTQQFSCQLSSIFYEYTSSDLVKFLGLDSSYDDGFILYQPTPNVQNNLNPNVFRVLPQLSPSTTYCTSALTSNDKQCSVLYSQSTISCKSQTFKALPSIKDQLSPTNYSLVTNPITLIMHGNLFTQNGTYICLFAQQYTTVAMVISESQITCSTPKITQNSTVALLVEVYRDDGLLIHRFTDVFTYFSQSFISSVSPLLADNFGGTPLLLTASNVILGTRRISRFVCQFKLDYNQQSAFYVTDSTFVSIITQGAQNVVIARCLTPAIQTLQAYTDVFVSLSEYDGTFALQNQARITFLQRITVNSVTPAFGFYDQRQLVTLKGQGYQPEPTLQVRLLSAQQSIPVYLWQFDMIFFVDSNTLVVRMPSIWRISEFDNGLGVFQVSINGGVSWSREQTFYQFYEIPIIAKLSHSQSNLRGNFNMTVTGNSFVPLINQCQFGFQYTNGKQIDFKLTSLATFVDSQTVICWVPASFKSEIVQFRLHTSNNYTIQSRQLNFSFTEDLLIQSIFPTIGDIDGGYYFTLQGRFLPLIGTKFDFYWNGTLINDAIVSVNKSQIMGIVPKSKTTGRIEIIIVNNLITYQNFSTYFYYDLIAEVDSCWPPYGPTRGGTMVSIFGKNLNDQIRCQFDGFLHITPIEIRPTHMICQMPTYYETKALNISLILWNNQKKITTKCTFMYQNDIQVNSIDPQHFIAKSQTPMILTVKGYNFRLDDPTGNQIVARLNQNIITQVNFTNSSQLQITLSMISVPGSYYLYISENYGVDYIQLQSSLMLHYHQSPMVKYTSMDKIQVQSCSDQDFSLKIPLLLMGDNFPSDVNIPFYCQIGGNLNGTYVSFASLAKIINETAAMCTNINLFCVDDPSFKGTILSIFLAYNPQDYIQSATVFAYPVIKIHQLQQYQYSQTQSSIQVEIHGRHFINTVRDLQCQLTSITNQTAQFVADYIFFGSSEKITCFFNIDPNIDPGNYTVSVSNNGVQWVTFNKTIQLNEALQIINVWPSIFITTPQPFNFNTHSVTIQTRNLTISDYYCFFMPKSVNKPSFFQTPDVQQSGILTSMIVYATKVNQTHINCVLPPSLSSQSPVQLDLRIGNSPDVKQMSYSKFTLFILDQCLPGYYCDYTFHECPTGHYCPGDAMFSYPRPCQKGYFQQKTRSRRCNPCLRGHFCDNEGSTYPVSCPIGFICDQQKLVYVNKPCPAGLYCPITAIQGQKYYQVGLYSNLTKFCAQGTYCQGGQSSNVVTQPENYESVVTNCLDGMICNYGSTTPVGVGECPVGHFCPDNTNIGIPCPPRYFCPGRGNIQPILCPKGTFNMHYGQQNCTNCTLGRICPIKGLFLPILCPPGYVCNDEGLITPENVCLIGHVCLGEVTSGLLLTEQSCQYLQVIANNSLCTGMVYRHTSQNPTLPTDDPIFKKFFNGSDVCCWTSYQVQKWIESIGIAINDPITFQIYAASLVGPTKNFTNINNTIVQVQQWDGLQLIQSFLGGKGITQEDGIDYIDPRHQFIIQFMLQKMFTQYMAELCPGGYLCIEAVNTYAVDGYLISQPYTCPSGSYCQPGCQTVIGSGLCPVGFYCPPQSTFPIPTPEGTFTGNLGSVEQSQCSPGTFQLNNQSSSCNGCPSGYQCEQRGTIKPSVCPVGTYRSVIESNICSSCPKGSFAFERGAKDYLECQECPPGRICDVQGISNITGTSPCTDGFVCASGTGAKSPMPCPEGYFCPPQTTDATMYDNQCLAGFFCVSATGSATKTQNNCPQTYYCPPGTGNYAYTQNSTDYTNWRGDAPTRCPQGTGHDNSDTKKEMLECYIDTIYRLMDKVEMSIRTNFGRNPLGSTTGSINMGRMLQAEPVSSISSQNALRGRNLESLIITSKDDPILLNLWEIEYEVYRFNTGYPPNGMRTYLNLGRDYFYRITPLNTNLTDKWDQIQVLPPDIQKNNVESAVFVVDPFNTMLITMDLRHLAPQWYQWTYGEDWVVSITVKNDTFNVDEQIDPIQSVLMPEVYLNALNPRNQVTEFEILAWDKIWVRVDILIYNSLYLNHKYMFQNSTSIDIRAPNRAIWGTQMVFAFNIQQGNGIMLPFNQPPFLQDNNYQPMNPHYSLTFAKNWLPNPDGSSSFNTTQQTSAKNRNVWIPASLYWGDKRTFINLAYIPYFSNCNGYGQIIPLWSLLEQNGNCSIYDLKDTIPMNEFSFGKSPVADNCNAIVIDCLIDENPFDQSPLPRWFEAQGEIMQLVVDPVDYNQFSKGSFTGSQILSVGPGDASTPGILSQDGLKYTIPNQVDFVISYYQKGFFQKKIIIVELDYTGQDEYVNNGTDYLIPYKLVFSFIPLSHTKLLIEFAFESYFYIILYFLIGTLSVTILILFGSYHRITARPYQGRIAPFRFFSFLKLTVPNSSYGVLLAIIPVSVVNIFISAAMSGHVLTIDTSIFSCDTADLTQCQLTIFDLVIDSPTNYNVDYTVLRNGRVAVALLLSGFYLLRVSLQILIPDTTKQGKVQEAYDGNIWNFYSWKRSNMVFCSMWAIFYSLGILQFSFCSVFGDSMYEFIVMMQLIADFIELLNNKAIGDALLVAPLSTTMDTVGGLVTFGSADLLAFIQSYFIGFGMQIFSRLYFDKALEFLIEVAEVRLPKMLSDFSMWLNNEVQEEVVDEASTLFGQKNKNEESETSDSKVNLSDEYSIKDDQDIESDKERDQNIIYQVEEQNDSSENNFDHKFKPLTRTQVDSSASMASKFLIEYGEEDDDKLSSDEEPSKKSDSSSEITLEDGLVEEDVEPLLEAYTSYANDNVSLYYACYFVILLWIFYDQTQVASNYGILIYDFVYYVFFQLVIIPFQIVVDIVTLNSIEWYQHLPIHDYLDYLNFRFSQRKTRWKGDEKQQNVKLEKNLRSLDKLCFSSQFYFVSALFVSGMCQIILGIQSLLWASNYNCFGDLCLIPIGLTTFTACIVVDKLTRKIGDWLGIWKVDVDIEGELDNSTDMDQQFFHILERINAFQVEEDREIEEEIPDHLKFKLKAWNQMDRIKIKDMQLKADLRTDRMIADSFKELFLQFNKPWLIENVQEVLTPRTIFGKRQQIIEQLQRVFGRIDPQITISEKSDESESKKSDGLDDTVAQEKYLKQKHKDRMARLGKKFGIGGEKIAGMIQDGKVTIISRIIIKYWVTRMRFLRKLRVFVSSTISLNIFPECLYCRYRYGLQVELLQNLEDMFYAFLSESGSTINNYVHEVWMNYFRVHARYRTVCQECTALIETTHKLKLKRERYESVLPKESDEVQHILMSAQQRKKHIERIRGTSDNAKLVLHLWVLLAKYQLNPDDSHVELAQMLELYRESENEESSLFDGGESLAEVAIEDSKPDSKSHEEIITNSKSQPSSIEQSQLLASEESSGPQGQSSDDESSSEIY